MSINDEARILAARTAQQAILRALTALGLEHGRDYVVKRKRAYKGGPVIGWRVDPITADDAGVSRFDEVVAEYATWLRDVTLRAGWPLIVNVHHTRSGQALSSVAYRVTPQPQRKQPIVDLSRVNVPVVGDFNEED